MNAFWGKNSDSNLPTARRAIQMPQYHTITDLHNNLVIRFTYIHIRVCLSACLYVCIHMCTRVAVAKTDYVCVSVGAPACTYIHAYVQMGVCCNIRVMIASISAVCVTIVMQKFFVRMFVTFKKTNTKITLHLSTCSNSANQKIPAHLCRYQKLYATLKTNLLAT